jgi:hypothetical protein
MEKRTRHHMKSLLTVRFKCERVLSLVVAGLSLFASNGQCGGSLYSSTVIADGPLAYYRFNDSLFRTNLNLNLGSFGSAGNATNLNTHLVGDGAIMGSHDTATYFDSTARTIAPWNSALNPNQSNDFTVEGWFNPSSDETFGAFAGPSPIMNRFSGAAINRSGWVYFQRSPDSSYANPDGVGWNFRTYTGVGSDVGVSITSQVPYRLGEWQYVVTVWNGASQTATMYINGTNVVSGTNTSGDPNGYVANTNETGQPDAPGGSAGFSVGSYNNTDPGSDAFMGAVADVAFYNQQLTPAQILAHYQNGTNYNRTQSYSSLIASAGPVGYWPLNDPSSDPNDVAVNWGTLQNAGEATNTAQVRHPDTSTLGDGTGGAFAYHFRNGSSTTDLPSCQAANNPPASVPFTLELWVRPTWDQIDTGEAPINNRYVNSGNRTGWVIFQRNPNSSYNGEPGASGVGWTFRMYDGTGSSGQDVLTDTNYSVGDWQHLVFTWQPQVDMGTNAANGDDYWQGTQTAYMNGNPVATNESALYCANTDPTDNGSIPADFAIGSYNMASGIGSNPFEGEIQDIAFYSNYILATNQIMDHYQARTNAHPPTNYATLVLTAEYDGSGTQGLQPSTYFRLNEPAQYPASNSGTLGNAATGTLVYTTNNVLGPVTAGFEATNTAVPVGLPAGSPGQPLGWVSLGNPPGLSISNQFTLEAWILPNATQPDPATIITHGPNTPSDFPVGAVTLSGIELFTNDIFLSITNAGSEYAFSYFDGTNYHGVAYPVGNDLTSNQWVYLAGTYDGTTWRLFRNGVQVTNMIDAVSAVTVTDAEWGIGSAASGWTNDFAGSIDEVAIYNTALSPAAIGAHYNAAQLTAVSLTITLASGQVTVTWSSGTLQEASVLSGPWTDLTGQTSPYKPTSPSNPTFYRVKQ